MIVYWPGKVPAGRVSDAAWSGTDFAPTALAIAHAKPMPSLDGASVLPLLLGQTNQVAAPH
jgi:arylsulfatase A-like enzyme